MALIYLVEDDIDIRELETYALQNSDLEVQSFADSTGLYEAIGKRIPDLVLLDIMLPGEDGMSILKHLRDVNTTTLNLPLRDIYKILLRLPENPTRTEVEQLLPDVDLSRAFSGHDSTPDRKYPVRGVVLYGLGEMRRAAKLAEAFKRNDLATVGKMFQFSHDGDRVVSYDKNWNPTPFMPNTGNSYILALLDDLDSGDVERVTRAQLEWQTGAYACSIPEIDKMVDIAQRTPGVIGAQLAGAGLGGCMMILTQNDAVDAVYDNLEKLYYAPANRPPRILKCKPVAGAAPIML